LYSLESRIYLYRQEWQKSLDAANKALAINSNLANLNSTTIIPTRFDGAESIFALEPGYTTDIMESSFASPELINAYSKTADLRFPLYFSTSGSHYIIEKGRFNENKCTIRTSELYLTKAETSVKLNNIADAKTTVLSFVKNRYSATGYAQLESEVNAMNTADLTSFILAERQREFVVEGQRWYDLRRTTQKQIVHTLKGTNYTLIQNDPRYTLIYPANARLNNPNL